MARGSVPRLLQSAEFRNLASHPPLKLEFFCLGILENPEFLPAEVPSTRFRYCSQLGVLASQSGGAEVGALSRHRTVRTLNLKAEIPLLIG